MILMNNGKFTKYSHVIQKQSNGSIIPQLYRDKKYDEIVNYVMNEADAFVKFYTRLQEVLPSIAYRRLDEFV